MEYYIPVSAGIALLSFLPFIKMFRGREGSVKKLVVLAVLVSVSAAGRYALSMFPNVKPMAAIAIISGASFGAESGFFVGAYSMFVSNILFGQGPWTPWQMFAMGLIGCFAGILFGKKGAQEAGKGICRLFLCIYGFLSVLCIYGGIMNPASLLMASYEINRETLLAVYLSGLPMDLVHAGSTVLFLAVGAEPIFKKLLRVKKKFVID